MTSREESFWDEPFFEEDDTRYQPGLILVATFFIIIVFIAGFLIYKVFEAQ